MTQSVEQRLEDLESRQRRDEINGMSIPQLFDGIIKSFDRTLENLGVNPNYKIKPKDSNKEERQREWSDEQARRFDRWWSIFQRRPGYAKRILSKMNPLIGFYAGHSEGDIATAYYCAQKHLKIIKQYEERTRRLYRSDDEFEKNRHIYPHLIS